MSKEMNLLVSVNKAYMGEVKDMLFSFAHYNKNKLNIYLMYIELDEEDIKDLGQFVEKRCHGELFPVKFNPSPIEDMPITDGGKRYFGLEAYCRLFSPYQLPESVERVLYLDADIVIGDSVEELYNMDFEGNYVVASVDQVVTPAIKENIGLPGDYNYINSGVLLMNLPEIRKNFTEKQIIELIIKQADIVRYPDQDFININFAGKIKVMSERYNLLVKDAKKENLTFKPAVYHYAGPVKAWHENVNSYDEAFIKPYYKCLFIQGKYGKLYQLYKIHSKNRKIK